MTIEQQLFELDKLLRFRLCDYRAEVFAAKNAIETYQRNTQNTNLRKCESIKEDLDTKCKGVWEKFVIDLRAHIISSVDISDEAAWRQKYDEIVARFDHQLDDICRKVLINAERRKYFQRASTKVDVDTFPVGAWATELNDKIAKLSADIMHFLENPIQKTNFDKATMSFTSKPEVKLMDGRDFFGTARIQVKNSANKVIFDDRYPLFIERNALNIISYNVQGKSPTQKANIYQSLSNILGNICFQEMCRNFGTKNNLFIHVWSPATKTTIIDRGFMEPLSFFQNYYRNGLQFVKQYGNNNDLGRLSTAINAPDNDSFNLLLVLYDGDDSYNNLKKVIEAAAVKTSNFLTVCICEDHHLDELRTYQGVRDGANLLTPEEKTTDFKSKLISIAEDNLVDFLVSTICGADCGALEKCTSATIDCDLWTAWETGNFNTLGLRYLIAPPPSSVAGEIMVEIGKLKGSPYYWRYWGSAIPDNAYVHGKTGTGKSYWLRHFIYDIASKYSPDEAIFYLCSLTKGDDDYSDLCSLPHVRFSVFSKNEKPHFFEMMLLDLMWENQNRLTLFESLKEINLHSGTSFKAIDGYHQACKQFPAEKLPPMPMIFFIIDEASPLVTDNNRAFSPMVSRLMQLYRQCRSQGIFILLASQDDRLTFAKDFNNFIKYDLSLAPPPNAVGENDGRRYKTLSQFPRDSGGTSIFLDTVEVSNDTEVRNKAEQGFAAQIKVVVDKYAQSKLAYPRFKFEDGSLPGIKSISILEEQIRKVLGSTTETCLKLYLGVFFGNSRETDIKSLREPYTLSLDIQCQGLEASKNLLIIDDASKDNPTYNSFWMSFMMSILLQKNAKVNCHIFEFNAENKQALETSLGIFSNIKQADVIISVSNSFDCFLEVLQQWKNITSQRENANGFFIVTINLDNLKTFYEDYQGQKAKEQPANMKSVKDIDMQDDKQFNLPNQELTFDEELLTQLANSLKKNAAKDKSVKPVPSESKKSQAQRLDISACATYEKFLKVLFDLATQSNSNRQGCFMFLQTSNNIDTLTSENMSAMRFLGFPHENRFTGKLALLPQKGDRSWVDNAGAYYGSFNVLSNEGNNFAGGQTIATEKLFLPIELESLKEMTNKIGS